METVLTQPSETESKGNTKKLTYDISNQQFDLNTAHETLKDDVIKVMKRNITRPTKFRMAFIVNFTKTNYEKECL